MQQQLNTPPHPSTAAVVMAIVATFRVLEPMEREVVTARWHLAEPREKTCERLHIEPMTYDEAWHRACRLIRNPEALGLQPVSAATN